MTQKLKICGVRSQAMLDACIAHNVDYLGINFVPSSQRRVGEELYEYLVENFQNLFPLEQGERPQADGIVLKNSQLVALFMNQSLAAIQKKLSSGIFSVVQLHGDETPEFCALIKEKFPDILIWKALTLREPQGAGAAESKKSDPVGANPRVCPKSKINFFAPYVDTFLFDGPKPGSGQTADLTELKKITDHCDSLNIEFELKNNKIHSRQYLSTDLSSNSKLKKIRYAIAGGINPDNIQLFRDTFTRADFFDTASGVEVAKRFCEEALIELLSN
jgi:phosphoribosylanthranilate isomerase